MEELEPSDWITIASIIVTFFTSLVAIFISVASLIQNRNILKEANAPKLIMYPKKVSNGFFGKYFVIKNIGNSETTITQILTEGKLHDVESEFLNSLYGVTLYPGQKLVSAAIETDGFGSNKINVTLSYNVYNKEKREVFTLDFGKVEKQFNLKIGANHRDSGEKISETLRNIAHENEIENL